PGAQKKRRRTLGPAARRTTGGGTPWLNRWLEVLPHAERDRPAEEEGVGVVVVVLAAGERRVLVEDVVDPDGDLRVPGEVARIDEVRGDLVIRLQVGLAGDDVRRALLVVGRPAQVMRAPVPVEIEVRPRLRVRIEGAEQFALARPVDGRRDGDAVQ